MASEHIRFLIIGGGIAGLSTAWHLSRLGEGERTVLLEAEAHLASHSSAVNAAILRSLAEDSISTAIGQRSARFLREPPAGFSEAPLVDAFGLLLAAGPERAEDLASWVSAMEPSEASHCEPLDADEVLRRAPWFSGDVKQGFWFPEEGRIDIGALVAGFARGARQGGVQIRRGVRVARLLEEHGRVIGARLSSGEEIRAETCVLAAGGWAGALGAAAGSKLRLRPTRRHLMVTAPQADLDRAWPVLWYFGSSEEGEFYCRPEGGGFLLCACDITDVDPERYDVDVEVRRLIASKASRYLPDLRDARAAHFWCGVRTLTEDGRFAIGPDPDVEGLFWVAGLGGSGMVCSAEVGRLAAEGLMGSSSDEDVMEALSPARLTQPALD